MADQPVPPQNLDAEESVIGAMMLNPAAIDAVTDVVGPADFYRASHGLVFAAAAALHLAGEPVDAITVADRLDVLGQLEQVGGKERIHELAALVPASGNAKHYAEIVREMADLRGLITGGEQIQRLAWDRPAPARELLDRAEGIVFELARRRAGTEYVRVSDALGPEFNRIQDAYARGAEIVGLATGYRALDRVTSGLQDGNLVVVAARPSMGKSALGIGVSANVAVHQGKPVAMFTLEMSKAEVVQRLLALEAHVELPSLRNGRLGMEEWHRLNEAAARIDPAPLLIDDSGSLTVLELRSRARRIKMHYPGLALVVVDYLQQMTGSASRDGRTQEVSEISRALKALARDLEVPVMALSQLSRAPESRHDSRPILSDLRDSGSIEQDADLVLFLYRDEYYHPDDTDQEGIAELNIAKHRNGATQVVKLAFVKRHASFSDLADRP